MNMFMPTTFPCGCQYECCQENLSPNTMIVMGGAYCKKSKGELKERKMRPVQREQLDAANRRLSKAAVELEEANANLDRCEREHRLASELVDHWERATANPEAKSNG